MTTIFVLFGAFTGRNLSAPRCCSYQEHLGVRNIKQVRRDKRCIVNQAAAKQADVSYLCVTAACRALVSHHVYCNELLQVLARVRSIAAAKQANVSYLLDTKGPEIRTAMLRGGQNLSLSKGQEVILVAVGSEYKTWEGGVNPDTGWSTSSTGCLC